MKNLFKKEKKTVEIVKCFCLKSSSSICEVLTIRSVQNNVFWLKQLLLYSLEDLIKLSYMGILVYG